MSFSLVEKANNYAEKFQTKTGKILAFWGSLVAMIGILPSIIGVGVWIYYFGVDLYNLSTYVREFKNSTEYNYFVEMQLISSIHEEMETVEHYGVKLEKTNDGDLWYFGTIEINGERRPVLYSANIKKKGKKIIGKNGEIYYAHIYIQNMKGEHVWIKDRK